MAVITQNRQQWMRHSVFLVTYTQLDQLQTTLPRHIHHTTRHMTSTGAVRFVLGAVMECRQS